MPGITLYTGLAATHGYDSNLDLVSTNPKGASFNGVEGGAAVVERRGANETTVALRGSSATYTLDYRPERWDAGLLIDHHMALQNGLTMTVGGFYYRDEIDTDRSQRLAGYMLLERSRDTSDAFLRIRSLNRDYLNAVGAALPAGSLFDVNSSFSNVRTEAVVGTLLRKDQRIAPFFQVGVAAIDFTKQIDTAVLNRNSREVFGIAGLRFTLSPTLHADIGGRVNGRDIDDTRVSHHSSAFFDGKLVWSPSDKFFVELNIDRTNEDPLAATALFSEETAARLFVTTKPTDRINATISGGFVRQDQIGASLHYDERYLEGKIGYKVALNAEIFLFGKAAEVTDSATRETSEVRRIGIGFKLRN